MRPAGLFGMIQPDPQGAPLAAGPALYRVGCLGRLSSFSETEDGRYLITLTGVIRFTVADELPAACTAIAGCGPISPALPPTSTRRSGAPASTAPPCWLAARAISPAAASRRTGTRSTRMATTPLITTLCHGLPVRAGREAGAAGSARPRPTAPAALAALLQMDIHASGDRRRPAAPGQADPQEYMPMNDTADRHPPMPGRRHRGPARSTRGCWNSWSAR